MSSAPPTTPPCLDTRPDIPLRLGSRLRLRLQGLQRLHVGPIDFTLAEGECAALMGPSGSGKSVLLRAIADLDPHTGDAWVDDVACSSLPAPAWRQRVAYVPAESGWWDDWVAPHFPPDYDFAHWLPQLGLDPAAQGWSVARLSTGERQRLALLRALRPSVRVLLLDEPTSGLHAEAVAQVEALLHRERTRSGLAVLLVTHSEAQALRMATRHWRLEQGQIKALAPDQIALVAPNTIANSSPEVLS